MTVEAENDEAPLTGDQRGFVWVELCRLGGSEGTRTPDPLHAMQVRYQLRHIPLFSSATLLGNKKIIHMPEARMQISTGSIRKTTREYCPPQGEKNEV